MISNWIENIKADAERILQFDPETILKQGVSICKRYLKVASQRLKIAHRAGGGGQDVCNVRSVMMDRMIAKLIAALRQEAEIHEKSEGTISGGNALTSLALFRGTKPNFSVVALGGYGRKELNPKSDIDLMFLYETKRFGGAGLNPTLERIYKNLLMILWDSGLSVGHSCRTLDDCVRVSNENIKTKTSLIDARLILGNDQLFRKMMKLMIAKCFHGQEDLFLETRLKDQAIRRSKYGNSPFLQEPNVKNGCGGLRDYQNLMWMAYCKYQVKSSRDLETREFISKAERRLLDRAYQFLLKVRTEIHYQSDHGTDILQRNILPKVSWRLGFTNKRITTRIELFMKEVYSHMKNIHILVGILEQRLTLEPNPDRLQSFRQILSVHRNVRSHTKVFDGLTIENGYCRAVSSDIFQEKPQRLMRTFLHLQSTGARPHPDLLQTLRNESRLVDRKFQQDPHVRETFLEIINHRGGVGSILRSMHEAEILGKYIPEFGKLTCLIQHEFYHQYASDEHTIVCLEKLDSIWNAKSAPATHYTGLLRGLDRPFVLYLALLLHDTGKAIPGRPHEIVGMELGAKVAERLKLDIRARETLDLLIGNHLLMAQISQRRDLDDPQVVREFATQIKTVENLDFLTLHTFADSTATSDQLWNGFKESLLWTLYSKARQMLDGETTFTLTEAKHKEHLALEVCRLMPKSFSTEELQAHFRLLPPRYYRSHTPKEILADLSLAHRFMYLQLGEENRALEPAILWHNEPDRGYASVKICTWDRPGLFTKIAGSLSAAGLNILNARIFSRDDGIVLDTFYVIQEHSALLPTRRNRSNFDDILTETLAGRAPLESFFPKKYSANWTPKFDSYGVAPVQVKFFNSVNDQWTLLEVITEDRPFLLYQISQALGKFDLDIAVAKIITEAGGAIDTFYIQDIDKGRITDIEIQNEIREAIIKKLAPEL